MRVLTPPGATSDTVKPLARRPSSLDRLRLGVLDNSKPNADVLLLASVDVLPTASADRGPRAGQGRDDRRGGAGRARA
jgi:hypothetical protein